MVRNSLISQLSPEMPAGHRQPCRPSSSIVQLPPFMHMCSPPKPWSQMRVVHSPLSGFTM